MWILIFIVFNGPMSVDRIRVLETYMKKSECLERGEEAAKFLPPKTSISCVQLQSVQKAKNL